ncbi:unnamed protein product [Haemonchus placei]|uniref:Prothymosin alpha-like n=1 Tax=Haemonchus placei TaxID=6290 RepID=A0A0N4VW37_HAEPC|nr:unnamed protein product [Haemonchus placei]
MLLSKIRETYYKSDILKKTDDVADDVKMSGVKVEVVGSDGVLVNGDVGMTDGEDGGVVENDEEEYVDDVTAVQDAE